MGSLYLIEGDHVCCAAYGFVPEIIPVTANANVMNLTTYIRIHILPTIIICFR